MAGKGQHHNLHRQAVEVWLVGGGTGGHIMPLLAVAEELKKDPRIKITYLGEKKGLEETLAKDNRIPFITITSGKLRRYVTPLAVALNIRDIGRLIKGIIKSYVLARKHRPAVLFSKGGPIALPVAIGAWLAHIPILTHESDVVIGITNRFIARFAKHILTAFPASYYPAILAPKLVYVGLPLRREFCQKHREHVGRPIILVTGASQGSVAINQVVMAILPSLLVIADVVHITGELSYKSIIKVKEDLPVELKNHYTVMAFTPQIVNFMAKASLIISRASSSIFEIATLGKPMVIIPLPSAANNHQLKNAEVFAHFNAAVVLRQESLTPQLLYEKIEHILTDKEIRLELQKGTHVFKSCDATGKVVDLIKEYAFKSNPA